MRLGRKQLIIGASVLVLAGAGVGVANAVGGDDEGQQATGPGADRARAAALEIVPGQANAVERDSENGATWEVEITKSNGKTVDVRLDDRYKLVVVEGDSEIHDEGAEERDSDD